MKTYLAVAAVLGTMASGATGARGSTVDFNFVGHGVSGALVLTYGLATDSIYPDAFEFTGISGTFTDTNNGLNIINAPVGPLVAVTHDAPEPGNLLAPHDFSKFAVASGLPDDNHGFLTYDNLFWPGGSPQTATDYPPHGGLLDIYGLMFSIPGGVVVDLFSNGAGPNGIGDYGVGVATASTALDYVGSGVSVPEPGSAWLLGGGLLGLLAGIGRARRLRFGRARLDSVPQGTVNGGSAAFR